MDVDGGNQIQLTDGTDLYPDISPDGQWVIYQSWNDGKNILRRVSINGGEPVKLTDYPTGRPTFSPDGKQIACTFTQDRTSPIRLAIIPADGGPPLKTFPMPSENEQTLSIFRWAPGGREIVNWRTADGVSNLWAQPVSGEPAKAITNFTSERIFWFDYSRNGQRLAISRGNLVGDVVLIKNLK